MRGSAGQVCPLIELSPGEALRTIRLASVRFTLHSPRRGRLQAFARKLLLVKRDKGQVAQELTRLARHRTGADPKQVEATMIRYLEGFSELGQLMASSM